MCQALRIHQPTRHGLPGAHWHYCKQPPALPLAKHSLTFLSNPFAFCRGFEPRRHDEYLYEDGAPGGITRRILRLALRASLRLFKIVPDNFVEPNCFLSWVRTPPA